MANALQICRICFSVNVKMFTLRKTNLENLYKLLTQVYIDLEEEGKPASICFLCYARLQQCEKLQQQAIKSNDLLEQLLQDGIMQDTANEILINKYSSQKLQVLPAYHIDLEPATCENILLDDANDAAISLISEELDEKLRLVLEKICKVQSEKELKDDPVPPYSTQIQQKDEGIEKITKIKLKPKKNAFVTKQQKNQKAIKNCVDGRLDTTVTKICNNSKRKLGKSNTTNIVTKKSKFQIPVICKDTIKETNICSETTLVNTTTKKFKCNKYDEQFCTNKVLTDHIVNCTAGTETSVNVQELTKEILNSPLPDMYSCDICAFKTNNKRCIEPHLKMHTVSKVFSCHICEYRSARKSHLKTHIRIHTGEKPFNCNICDYKCAQKNTLKNHMRTHTGDKPFNFNICDYKCARKTSLKYHMTTHTGEKPFSCNICEYTSAYKSDLKKHVMTHTGDKPFSCDMCDYRCILKSHLKSHLRTHK